MKKRLSHIDNAKAIGMMLIIASHIIPSEILAQSVIYKTWDGILNSFYVPLFFLLSGIFEPINVDDKKMLKRVCLLIKFCAFFYFYGVITDGLIRGNWSLFAFKAQTTIWFLIVLLWITLIVGMVKRLRWRNLFFLLITMGGVILSIKHMSIMYLGQACICLPFYLLGFYGRNYLKREKRDRRVLVVSFIIWIFSFYKFYSPQNLSINLIEQNILAFYLEAIAGSFVVIELCKMISCRVLCFFGRNSIVPMMVQFSIIWLLMKFVRIESLSVYVVTSLAVCILSGFCIPLFRNKLYDIFK